MVVRLARVEVVDIGGGEAVSVPPFLPCLRRRLLLLAVAAAAVVVAAATGGTPTRARQQRREQAIQLRLLPHVSVLLVCRLCTACSPPWRSLGPPFGLSASCRPSPTRLNARTVSSEGQAREEHVPPGGVEDLGGVGDHRAPARGRGLDADAEERQRRLEEDVRRDDQRRVDDDRRDEVRQDLAEDDAACPRRPASGRPRRTPSRAARGPARG